ncbi:MAG: gliding motility-associated C-terminal domain-containing protein, partial [Chitinophagaceae bacterium]|nr:gliding motility-associated C-terminal domain-containing protein [Chitinophagaceae bacterium]
LNIGSIALRVTGLQGPYRLLPSTGGGFVTESITVRQLTEGAYGIGVYNRDGCRIDSILYNLVVANPEDCFRFYMPTAFTPNADGLNDVIKPQYASADSDVRFEVYNRYGQKVFSTNQKQTGWNGVYQGKKQNSGTYIWYVRYTDGDGKVQQVKGTFILIR